MKREGNETHEEIVAGRWKKRTVQDEAEVGCDKVCCLAAVLGHNGRCRTPITSHSCRKSLRLGILSQGGRYQWKMAIEGMIFLISAFTFCTVSLQKLQAPSSTLPIPALLLSWTSKFGTI